MTLTESVILKLGVKELKKELRKQGCTATGKKADLIICLQDAILNSVPVSESVEIQHESLNGLDMSAKWVEHTIKDILVPEPRNDDGTIRPPTERNATTNPKYGFKEKFQ